MKGTQKLVPGKEVTIGEKTYTLPPLSLGQLRNGAMDKLRKHDEFIAEQKGWDAMLLKGEIILTALQRNYPDLKAKDIDEALDLGNVNDLWLHVLGLSGFTPGEAPATTAIPSADGT